MDNLKFSQRIGQTPATKKLQIDSMDNDLRNSLWNQYRLILDLLDKIRSHNGPHSPSLLFQWHLWVNFFKNRSDEFRYNHESTADCLDSYFFECEWYQVYDLIELTLNLIDNKLIRNDYDKINKKEERKHFNEVLKRENAAYRFINEKLAPVTNSSEIEEIQKAIDDSGSFTSLEGCNIHLNEALNKLSDKQNPDFRNSIKESISAVESLVKVISGKGKNGLAPSLDKMKGKMKLHQALVAGFKSIYGYTSDDDGIRHAIMGIPNCDIEDARFMLVSCSAFVNYLIAKAHKADIKLT